MRLEFEYTFADYQEAARYKSPVVPGRRTLSWLLVACGLVVGVGLIANWLLFGTAGGIDSEPGNEASLAHWMPWLVVLAVIWVTTFLLLRRGTKSEWEETAWLARRQAVEVWPDRLVTWDAAHRAEYLWAYFVAVRETKTLFLLYPCDTSTRIIPKRAVPDAAQLEWLRAMLRQVIARKL